MPRIDVVKDSPIIDSFRVSQTRGIFDLQLEEFSRVEFHADIPGLDEKWNIGAIVGPSGSGKSSIAYAAFSDAVWNPHGRDWGEGAVVDYFGEDMSIRDITAMFTSVGFSSPPAWLRPYSVLSNGEKFRVDLARALLETKNLCVFDEFTSVVDRTVAKIGSVAVANAIRKTERQFVAVSCHYDILEWLCPDWTLDMATGTLARGALRRPPIELRIFPSKTSAWTLFKKHHYLTGGLNPSAQCWLGMWGNYPVCFCAILPMTGRKNFRRVSRMVTLPDFQGVGFAGAMLQCMGEYWDEHGCRLGLTTSHPGMISSLKRRWMIKSISRHGHSGHSGGRTMGPGRSNRPLVSFEFRRDATKIPPLSQGVA